MFINFCLARTPDYFKWEAPGIGRNLLYSFTFGSVLFLLLIIIEYKVVSKLIDKLTSYTNKTPVEIPDIDSDVYEEKLKIQNTNEYQLQKDNILVLKDITKYYKKFLAVNGISLGIKRFECFGLLGVNGAGKTTTFKMMTGDVKITHGEAWVNGFSIKTQLKNVQKLIG